MNEIIFLIEDNPEGGHNAQALGYSIFTKGEIIEEIKENIADVISCYFIKLEDIPKICRFRDDKYESISQKCK